jgi:hypothetical protein
MQLRTYRSLSLFLTIYVPKYLPFFRIYYNRYKLSIFYLRSSLLTLSLFIDIASIFIVPYELFTILCTIKPLDKFRSDPIHKGTIVSSFDLTNMVFADFIFVKWNFIYEYVPRATCNFFVFVSDLYKLFEVWISLIAYKFVFLSYYEFFSLLYLLPPFF